jgi:AraC-like DNA-binding protein
MREVSDDIQVILERQIIPWWDRYGTERLAVSAKTLRDFKAQPLSPLLSLSVKKRQGKKVVKHGPRSYNNASTLTEIWPQDAQDTCRHPILVCVVKGHAYLHIADYVVHSPAGHFFLMRPGVPQFNGKRPHLEESNTEGYCELFHMSLLPGASCITCWMCYSQGKRHWSHHHQYLINQPDMLHQFNFFIRESLETPDGYLRTASNSLSNFFLLFLRELKAGRLPIKTEDNEIKPSEMESTSMSLARQYMVSHLHEHLTSAKVADAVFMSRTSFLRHFPRETGQSFTEYLTMLRLEKAQQLLSMTGMSVRSAGDEVGLKQAQLYRIFKKHLTVSPSEFQQRKKMDRND